MDLEALTGPANSVGDAADQAADQAADRPLELASRDQLT
jgi:hypothetical protein